MAQSPQSPCFKIEDNVLLDYYPDEGGGGVDCSFNLVIPDGVKTISSEIPHANMPMNITIKIPSSVTEIAVDTINDHDYAVIIADSDSFAAEWAAKNNYKVIDPNAKDGFTIVNGVLTAYTGSSEDVTVPDGVNAIGAHAFQNIRPFILFNIPENPEINVKKVNLPESVSYIGYAAFFNSEKLEEIHFSENIECIDTFAFEYCSKLTKIQLPKSLTEIGLGTFRHCTGLTEVEIPEGVIDIGMESFLGCNNLKKIMLPRSFAQVSERSQNFNEAFPKTSILWVWRGSFAEQYAKEKEYYPDQIVYRDDAGIRGDLNGDGKVDMTDLILLIHVILGDDVEIVGSADLDEDGAVNMSDLIMMIHIILGDPVSL